MGSSKEKDNKGKDEKEKSHLDLATGAIFTEEEPQSYKKRKPSLKEIKRRECNNSETIWRKVLLIKIK